MEVALVSPPKANNMSPKIAEIINQIAQTPSRSQAKLSNKNSRKAKIRQETMATPSRDNMLAKKRFRANSQPIANPNASKSNLNSSASSDSEVSDMEDSEPNTDQPLVPLSSSAQTLCAQAEAVIATMGDSNPLGGLIASLIHLVGQLTMASTSATPSKVKLDAHKIVEESERAHSVVVIGLPEKSGCAPSESRKNDVDLVDVILDDMEVEATPHKIYRLGKPRTDGKPRLMKLVLATRAHQRAVLRAAKKLKENYPKVFIRPSMTRDELDRHKKLVQEMVSLRRQGLYAWIYNGKVYNKPNPKRQSKQHKNVNDIASRGEKGAGHEFGRVVSSQLQDPALISLYPENSQ